ncbi:hypothetical protein UlMin_040398 [Ulmus minor]
MATCSYLLNQAQIKGWPPQISRPGTSERYKFLTKRHVKLNRRVAGSSTLCCLHLGASPTIELSQLHTTPLDKISDLHLNIGFPETSNYFGKLVIADLDPATAKLAIGFLGPFFSVFAFLFILRIIMSWYPKLPVGKFPYVIAYAPTEPLLVPTRKLIPPLGGVDVTPVVWFGLVSFLNEILVGPQGLLVLLSQQVSQ